MSTSKIDTAIMWLNKEGSLLFDKIAKTLVQKRGRGDQPLDESEPDELVCAVEVAGPPLPIPLKAGLTYLKEAAKRPAAPEPKAEATAEMKNRLDELEKRLRETATAKAEELAALQKERDELYSKLTAEQLTTAELNCRVQELESRWTSTISNLERVRGEATNRELSEAEVRSELERARQAMFYMEAALKEEVVRREKLSEKFQALSHSLKQERAEGSKRFEQEMLALRQERDDLTARLAAEQKDTTESTRRAQELESRLSKNAAEFDRAKTQLARQEAERQRIEAEWREQLDAAHALRARLEFSLTEARDRTKRLELEVLELRGEYNELKEKLAAAERSTVELEKIKRELQKLEVELEKQTAEQLGTETEWRKQLARAQALASSLESSFTESTERNKDLEGQLTELRRELAAVLQERDELRSGLKTERSAAHDAKRHVEDLEGRLEHISEELERAKAEAEKREAALQRAESNFREQLEAANVRCRQLEAAGTDADKECKRFAQELAGLKQERDELCAKLISAHASITTRGKKSAVKSKPSAEPKESGGLDIPSTGFCVAPPPKQNDPSEPVSIPDGSPANVEQCNFGGSKGEPTLPVKAKSYPPALLKRKKPRLR